MYLKLSDFGSFANGKENCFEALKKCFEKAAETPGAVVVIEPGEYYIDSSESVPLCSHLKVYAEGAVFKFPRDLGEHKIRRMFCGRNIENFEWQGGHFEGYVYDVNKKENLWPPHAFTGCICIYASEGETVKNIRIRNVTGTDVSGTIVSIEGCVETRAENIDVKDCNFIRCARFMWDYGYLWQRVVFSHEYDNESVLNAFENIPKEHISSELRLCDDGSICADFMPKALPLERDAVTFFGDELPEEVQRGKQYFVLNKGAENSLFISETEKGEPIRIGNIAPKTYLFRNMFYVFHDLYSPFAAIDTSDIKVKRPGNEKGAISIIYANNVNVSGCRISGEGDSTHISQCENVVFVNNQILGSRMGAMFIGFFCKNVTITGNTVYGTNGSRTLSVECGTTNITVTGNIFVGGGRGNWFSCARNVIISDNIFDGNTLKCVPDVHIGRICHVTGEFEKYPELYFTSTEDADEYGPVIIKGNTFYAKKDASAAIAFNPGGKDILIEGNVFRDDVRDIHIASGCEEPLMVGNVGVGEILDRRFVNTANSR